MSSGPSNPAACCCLSSVDISRGCLSFLVESSAKWSQTCCFFFVFLHLEGALHTVEEKSTLVTFWVSLSPGAAPWAGPVEAGGGCAMVQLVFVEQRCRAGLGCCGRWAAGLLSFISSPDINLRRHPAAPPGVSRCQPKPPLAFQDD